MFSSTFTFVKVSLIYRILKDEINKKQEQIRVKSEKGRS